jgi:hypothetical protein
MEFLCESCNGVIDADLDWVGQASSCPHCGLELVVPQQAQVKTVEETAPHTPAPVAPPKPVAPPAPVAPAPVAPTPTPAIRSAPAPRVAVAPQPHLAPARAVPSRGVGYPGQPHYEPQMTSGLAIASLIVTLIGAIPIGIILAHISRGQIARDPRQKGSGIALTSLVIGYGIFALFLALIAGGVWSFTNQPDLEPSKTIAKAKVPERTGMAELNEDLKAGKAIEQAIRSYSTRNGGLFPRELKDLTPRYLHRDELMCAGDLEKGRKVPFQYYTGYNKSSESGILLSSPKPVKDKRAVIRVDGSTEILTEKQFQVELTGKDAPVETGAEPSAGAATRPAKDEGLDDGFEDP